MSIYATSVLPGGIQTYANATLFPITGFNGQQALDASTSTIYVYSTTSPVGWKAVANPGAATAIDALTGDVTATGPGVVASTVAKIQGNAVSGTTGTVNVVFSDNPTFTTGITLSSLTANQILASSSGQGIISLTTATYPSLTELSYVKGVTSSVQTQLNNKQPFAAVTRITKATNYNISSSDDYIGCDTTTAPFTLTLPSAATTINGKAYIIKDEGGNCGTNHLLLAPSGTDQVDGITAGYSLTVNFESVTVVCNGTNGWFLI